MTDAATPAYLDAIRQSGKPLVLISKQLDGVVCPTVQPDNKQGVREAVRHLIAHGHRKIAFVGMMHQDDIQERHAAYVETLLEAGIEPDPTLVFSTANNEEEYGVQAGQAMLADGLAVNRRDGRDRRERDGRHVGADRGRPRTAPRPGDHRIRRRRRSDLREAGAVEHPPRLRRPGSAGCAATCSTSWPVSTFPTGSTRRRRSSLFASLAAALVTSAKPRRATTSDGLPPPAAAGWRNNSTARSPLTPEHRAGQPWSRPRQRRSSNCSKAR